MDRVGHVDSNDSRFSYVPDNLKDGDPTTSWQTRGHQKKRPVILDLKFRDSVNIESLRLWNGYQKSAAPWGDLYYKNQRIRRLKICVNDATRCIETEISDHTGPQEIRISENHVTKLTLHILSWYTGSKWQDLAISEIEVVQKPSIFFYLLIGLVATGGAIAVYFVFRIPTYRANSGKLVEHLLRSIGQAWQARSSFPWAATVAVVRFIGARVILAALIVGGVYLGMAFFEQNEHRFHILFFNKNEEYAGRLFIAIARLEELERQNSSELSRECRNLMGTFDSQPVTDGDLIGLKDATRRLCLLEPELRREADGLEGKVLLSFFRMLFTGNLEGSPMDRFIVLREEYRNQMEQYKYHAGIVNSRYRSVKTYLWKLDAADRRLYLVGGYSPYGF
ncbi:MAG: hypothetical protein CMN77_05885 [Spirochaetaceae bacterium]|nr:hypothetical protein [Spirochaetaceae bacterium]